MKYASSEKDVARNVIKITTIQCPPALGGCGSSEVLEVQAEDVARYNRGVHIQNAFPYLTAAQRERLMSGLCDSCYEKLWIDV